MSHKISYEIRCGFDYSKVTIEIEAEDGEIITPEELDEILHEAVDDYAELDLGADIH